MSPDFKTKVEQEKKKIDKSMSLAVVFNILIAILIIVINSKFVESLLLLTMGAGLLYIGTSIASYIMIDSYMTSIEDKEEDLD